MPEEKITATEARQATVRPRAMVLVLFASLFLCLIAGLGLALGWFSLPSLPQSAPAEADNSDSLTANRRRSLIQSPVKDNPQAPTAESKIIQRSRL